MLQTSLNSQLADANPAYGFYPVYVPSELLFVMLTKVVSHMLLNLTIYPEILISLAQIVLSMKQEWLSHYHSKTKLNRYRYNL